MAWAKLRVELEGEAEPAIVQTTARDWADVELAGDGGARPVSMMFQVAHAALLRLGYSVPRSYDEFLEVLASMPEEVDGAGDAQVLDPTGSAPSGGPP